MGSHAWWLKDIGSAQQIKFSNGNKSLLSQTSLIMQLYYSTRRVRDVCMWALPSPILTEHAFQR